MDNTRKFPLILSSFWLKVIALVTMAIDHVGYSLVDYGFISDGADVFRIIGRIALPLFCFMIAEGAMRTKSFGKYALRLGIMAAAISIALIVAECVPQFPSMRDQGIIFLDLLLGAVAVFCLRQKKWYIKALAILPLLYGIGSFVASFLENCGCHGHILWFPFFLRTQYGWYGILLIILFYLANLLGGVFTSYLSGLTGIPKEQYKDTDIERHAINIISVFLLLIATLLLYLVGRMLDNVKPSYVYWMLDIQLFAMLAGAFILLYNGRRGYNKKWFQYGSYLFYPVHLAIIYLVFEIIWRLS